MPAAPRSDWFVGIGLHWQELDVGDATPGEVAIVDDDEAVRDSLRFLLEVAGHSVASFASGVELLTNPRHFACLIVDQHMPQMTGLDLVARLRNEGETMPILLITGSLSAAIIAQAAALGVTEVLEKPASDDAMLEFVSAAIR